MRDMGDIRPGRREDSMTRSRIRLAGGLVAALLTALAIAGPATARSSVDPNTLNPPPPDFFNADCQRTGSQIVCSLHFDTVDDVFDEPSGIICGSTELLFSQQRAVVGKRYYDASGNLLVRHFRESFVGDFTNPDTGKVATWTQHDTVIHRLGTPGDLATGFTSVSGQLSHVRGPDGRTILIDGGRSIIDESTGEIVTSHGPHHFDDYFARGDTTALDALCNALD
jgi:hypothetical protein